MKNNQPGKNPKIFELVFNEDFKANCEITIEDIENILKSLELPIDDERYFNIYWGPKQIEAFDNAMKSQIKDDRRNI